jgi:hypothetical protein
VRLPVLFIPFGQGTLSISIKQGQKSVEELMDEVSTLCLLTQNSLPTNIHLTLALPIVQSLAISHCEGYTDQPER